MLKNLFQLKNSVAFVTGAGGQLGRQIVRVLAQQGARVVLVDQESDAAEKNARILGLTPKRALILECDIRRQSGIRDCMEKAAENFGMIDILVNNAGVSVFEPFLDRPESSIDWVMDVNLKGTLFCIQEFVRQWNLRKAPRKTGSIINIASHYGLISPDPRIYTDCERKNSEIYGATKAGVIQMTRYFAVHLAGRKIRVNAISPGGVLNPEKPQGKDFRKRYAERCPLGRMANAEEIQGPVAFLASEASSYVTGHNLIVDGGMSCW
ncbi:MAG: SDR family oxidoreductase [Candidatus Omnitrophica bacterium]|nr:SDR family oxidoreductase [Candidatus Omnitrophota bacterium]